MVSVRYESDTVRYSQISVSSERISLFVFPDFPAAWEKPTSPVWLHHPLASGLQWHGCGVQGDLGKMLMPCIHHGLYMVYTWFTIYGLYLMVNLGEFGSAMLHAFRRSWITRSSHRWIPRTRWDPVTVEIAGHNSNQRWCFCIKLFNKCSTVQYSYFL